MAGTAAATTSYTQGNLTPGTNYYIHVRGVGASGNYTAWTHKAFSTLPTGIEPAAAGAYRLLLMPNPNRGVFTLRGSMPDQSKASLIIKVMNAIGQVICQTEAPAGNGGFSKTVELTAPAGWYTVQVGNGSAAEVIRFSLVP